MTIGEFDFEICLMFGKRNLDRAVVGQKRRRRLEPDERRAERRAFHLRDMIGVIETDGDELLGATGTSICNLPNEWTSPVNWSPSQYGCAKT